MGGVPPYGYRVENRKLVVDDERAAHVRWIFARFLEIGSCTELAREVGARGIRTPRGNRIDKKYIYRMLNNRAYIGEAVHKGDSYPGEHDAIIDRETWDRVHAILQESPRKRAARTRADTPALLKGLLFGPDGAAFSPTHTRKGGQALPLLCQPDGAEAWRRVVPGRPRACGRDRGRRHRPAARRVPPARDRGGDVEGGAGPGRRHHRGRRPRGPAAARPAVGRTLPRRAGAHRGAAGRARRHRHGRAERPAPRRRPRRPRARDAGRQTSERPHDPRRRRSPRP